MAIYADRRGKTFYRGHLKSTEFIYALLANSSGEVDMSTQATTSVFSYTVANDKVLHLMRINVALVDGAMRVDRFGGMAGALSTGLGLGIFNPVGTQTLDFTDGQNIKQNSDWSLLAGVDASVELSQGDDFLPVRFTVAKATGVPMRLSAGWSIRATVNDDINAITELKIMIQGALLDASIEGRINYSI
jgi:hypothetical protein